MVSPVLLRMIGQDQGVYPALLLLVKEESYSCRIRVNLYDCIDVVCRQNRPRNHYLITFTKVYGVKSRSNSCPIRCYRTGVEQWNLGQMWQTVTVINDV